MLIAFLVVVGALMTASFGGSTVYVVLTNGDGGDAFFLAFLSILCALGTVLLALAR
jgi:hypothetical protein